MNAKISAACGSPCGAAGGVFGAEGTVNYPVGSRRWMRQGVLVLSLLGLALLVAAGSEAAVPEATIMLIDPQVVDQQSGETVRFEGDYHDEDDDQLQEVYWNSSLDGVIHSGGQMADMMFEMASSDFSRGNHSITLTVQAGGEWSAAAESWLNITGTPPRNPEASITINPPTVHQGEVANFVGAGDYYDPATRIESYLWTINGDWLSDEMTFVENDFSIGDHTIELVVTDDLDQQSEPVQAMLSVLPPIPLAHIDSISPSPAKEGQVITLAGHCTGASGDVEVCDEYRWDIRSGDGGSTLFSLYNKTVTVDNLTEGNYKVWFRIVDSNGTLSPWVSDSLSVGQPNDPPMAIITIISPDPRPGGGFTPDYYQFQSLTFSATSSTDDDGSIIGWNWEYENVTVSTAETWEVTFDTPVENAKAYLQVQDDNGAWSGSNFRQFSIVPNTPPNATILLSPATVEPDAAVTLNGSGSDAEGSIAGWEWSLDGVIVATVRDTTVASNTAGLHEVTLRVLDDGGLWSEPATASFTVTTPDVAGPKYLAVSVSSTSVAVSEELVINLTATTGPVEEFEIVYGGQTLVTTDRIIGISFDAAGTHYIDITVRWSDGSSFDSSRDYYTTTVTVSRSGGGGTDGDGDGDGSDGSGGGIPGPGLLAALAGLGLAARRKR